MIHVPRLARANEGFKIAETKTGRARLVLLTTAATEALRRRRLVQSGERERAGSEWVELPFVFTIEFGRPLDPSNVRLRSFQPALERAALPCIRFHDLRHTHATLLLGAGVHPKIVQERLGHASSQVTLDTYSHAVPSMQEGAVQALEALLGGP